MNDSANILLLYLMKSQHFENIRIIRSALINKYPSLDFTNSLEEFKRLGIVAVRESDEMEQYLLKESIRRELKILPREFISKPYDYLLDIEQKKLYGENKLQWYNLENVKTQYENYPIIEKRANVSIILSIATIIVMIVLQIIRWRCNMPN